MVSELVRNFPKQELYGLSSQMQRAADSVALNIAEGSTGQTDAEQRRILGIALRSALEVVCALFVAKARGLINQQEHSRFYAYLEIHITDLQAFRNSLR